ncbi:MAG: transglutaminase domain-containing protein [Gemmatimonadetes bacterium]|nr:transglutaminase domain-containing protein [Gemmatimonadota bacterium]
MCPSALLARRLLVAVVSSASLLYAPKSLDGTAAAQAAWTLQGFRVERFGRPGAGPMINSLIPEGSLRTDCFDVGPDRLRVPLVWRLSPEVAQFRGMLSMDVPQTASGAPFAVRTSFAGVSGPKPPDGVILKVFVLAPVQQGDRHSYGIAIAPSTVVREAVDSTAAERQEVSLGAGRTSIVFEATSYAPGIAFAALRVTAFYAGAEGRAAEPPDPDCSPYAVTLVPNTWLGQLVPRMRAPFTVRVYFGGREPVDGATLRLAAQGGLLTLTLPPGPEPAPRDVHIPLPRLAPGSTITLEHPVIFRVADEDEPRIREHVIPESGGVLPLAGSVHAEVLERARGGAGATYRVSPELLLADGSEARVEYPDFARRLGSPGPVEPAAPVSAEEAEYNRTGDPGWHHSGNAQVRGLAVRAASYDAATGTFTDFPDSGRRVAENLRRFVYHALNPKSGSRDALRDDQFFATARLVPEVYRGLQPRYDDPDGYVCIEHAYLFTALLRTLGIPAKEVNTYLRPALIFRFQTAGAMVWAENPAGTGARWWFHDPYLDIDDPDYYVRGNFFVRLFRGRAVRYRSWYGVRATPSKFIQVNWAWRWYGIRFGTRTGEGTRFTIPDDEMDASPYWRRWNPRR